MRVCTICNHAAKSKIDECLVSGESYRSIAKQFSVSPSAVNRHKEHIPASLTVAKQATEAAEATSLLSRVENLMERCEGLFDGASKDRQWAGAAAAARELRGCLELIGKLSGELKTAGPRIAISLTEIQSLDIKMLTGEQLEALAERLQSSRTQEVLAMSDAEIEVELASIFGVGRPEYLMPEVTFTEVESAILAGFHSDSEVVQRQLKEKAGRVEAYKASQARLAGQTRTIQGVR